MNEAIRMQLSAFADGELPDNEKELLLRRLSQDSAMRRQVAEYLNIGRAMRGEMQFAGIEQLRERIAAAIDAGDPPSTGVDETGAKSTERSLGRPLAGFALAATVAMVAIFGLRQASDIADPLNDQANAASADTAFPTQPEADNVLKQYRMLHGAEAADSSMRTRFTSIEIRQEIAEDSGTDGAVEDDEPETEPDATLVPVSE